MKSLKVFFIIAFSFSTLSLTVAVDSKDAGDLWLAAYSLYEKAEQYYGSEDYSSSLVYYQKALKKFGELHDAYSDWNSELVSYRMTHCEEKEAIIKSKLVQGNMDKSSDELVKENIELQSKLADYQDKLANEQASLKDALNRTEKNQGEFLKSNEATERLRQVMKEKIELEKKYSLVNEGLGKGSVENSNLIENLRNDMEQQQKKLEKVLNEKQKIENEHNEFKKKYSDVVLQKADIDYRLKIECEKSKNGESNYLQASKQIYSLSEKIRQLTVEKDNLTKSLSVAKTNIQEERQSKYSLKADIENGRDSTTTAELSRENSSLKKQVQDFQKEIDRLNGIKDSYSYELNKSKEIQVETAKTISSLQSRYSAVGEEVENLRKVLNENEARELGYSKKITEMAARLAESKEEYRLLTVKCKDLENKQGDLAVVQSKNLDLEQEKKQLSEQIKNYQLQAEETKKQTASIRDAKEKLEKEQVTLIQDNLFVSLESENKYRQKVNDLNESNRKVKELEASNIDKERKLNEILNKMKSSEENYASLHKDNNKLQQELLDAKSVIDGLRETNAAQLKDASSLSEQLRLSNIKNQEYERIKNNLESAINDTNSRLANLKREQGECLEKYNDLMGKYRGQEKLTERIRNESTEKDRLIEADRKLNDLKEASNKEEVNMNSLLDSINKLSGMMESKEKGKKEVEKLLADSIGKNKEYEQQGKHDAEKLQNLLNELKKRNEENKEVQKARDDTIKKLAETNSELFKFKNQQDRNKQEIERLKKQLSSLDEKSRNFSREKNELNKKITDYERKAASSEAELKKGQEEAKRLTDSLADYQKKIGSLSQENQELKSAAFDAGNRISSLEKDKKGSFEKIKALTDKLEKADRKEQHTDALISLSEEKNISLNAKINEIEKSRCEQSLLIDSLQKQLEAVNKEKNNSDSGTDIESLNTKLVEVSCKLAASEEKLSRQNSAVAKYQDDYKNLQRKLSELQDNRNAMENKYAEAMAKVKSQEKINKEQEKLIGDLLGRINSLSISLNESKQGRDSLTQQLVEHSERFNKTKKDYESQISRFNAMIEEGRENGGKSLRLTADKFALINSLKEAEKQIEYLKQRQEEQLKKMNALSLSLDQKTANDHEKEALNKNINVKLATAMSRLDDLENERVAASVRVNELLNGISERDGLLKSQKDANARMTSALVQAQKSIADLKKKESENTRKAEDLLAQLQKSEQDKMCFASENGRKRNELSSMKSELDKITTDNKSRNEKLTKTVQELNDSNIKLEMANAGLAQLERKYKSALNSSGEFEKKLQEKINSLTAESKKKDETISNLVARKIALEDQIVKANKNIDEMNGKITDNNQGMMKELDSAKNELSSVMKEKTSLQEKMQSLLAQLNEVSTKNGEVKLQKQKLEESLLYGKQSMQVKDLDIEKSRKQMEELAKKVNELKESLSKSDKKVVLIQGEYEKILNKNANMEKSFQSLKKQFVLVKNDLKEAKIRAKNLESINSDFQGRLLDGKNKIAALQRDASEKTEIINGLTKEIDGFKQQISDSVTSQVPLKSKLEGSLSIVDSLKKDKSELLHRMEFIISESDKLAKEKQETVNKNTENIKELKESRLCIKALETKEKRMTDEISMLKDQLSKITAHSSHTSVAVLSDVRLKEMTQKNKELLKKIAEVSRRLALEKFNRTNHGSSISIEDKKRTLKLIMSANQAIKKNDNILGYKVE